MLTASSGLPGTQTGRAAPRPLFGLAPSGVYHATSVSGSPVRSYRTLSPLPVPPPRRAAGHRRSTLCGTFRHPLRRNARGARALPGTLPCGARTFLRRNHRGGPTATLTSHTITPISTKNPAQPAPDLPSSSVGEKLNAMVCTHKPGVAHAHERRCCLPQGHPFPTHDPHRMLWPHSDAPTSGTQTA